MTYHARYSPRFTNLPHDGKLFVRENTTFVIDVQSEDNRGSEQNGQLKYSIIGGVDAEFFEIDRHTGELSFKSPPDFENDQSNYNRGDNIYDVKIQVEDAAHYTARKTLWIMVTDVDESVNEKPKFTNLPDDGKLMIHENTTFVIDAEASDDRDSEGNGLKYSIVGGVDAEFFEIDMTTGELSFKHPPDFENDQSNWRSGDNIYDVTIRVEDSHGAFHDKPLWVKVKDKPEPNNEGFCLDFETDGEGNALERGQIIDDEFAALGITVFGVRRGEPLDGSVPNRVMIFDSENPTGGDGDLATGNQGNLAIISEDGDSNDPDDNARGGTFVFEFDSPRDLTSLGFVDIEERGGEIRAFDSSGNLISTTAIPVTGNGAQQSVSLDIQDASRLEVELAGSGALSKLGFGKASVGDFVFNDLDGDGIQDAGEEGVEGVTVALIGGGADGVIGTGDDTTETTTTDSNGFYEFSELNVGEEYQLDFDLPDGFEFTTQDAGGNDALDSDADPASGQTDVFTLKPGEFNSTFDAGLIDPVDPGSIGDKVFNDLDGDGIQDPNEPGIEGVTVTISGAGDDGIFGTADDVEVVTTTDADGNYSSGPLDPGDYKVTFSDLPDGFEFTTPNAGGDDGLDSDADPTNGMTEVFTLAEGEDKDDVDAGLIDPVDPAHLGNRVFLDEDRDGIQDPGEQGLEGVTVTIDGAGDDGIFGTADDIQIVTTTNVNGIYRSGDIPPGDYKVTFSGLPDGFEFSPQDQGGDDTADSDVDPTNGMTEVITLVEGESNNTVDAGVVAPIAPGSIGDKVFNDLDGDGIQDPNEPGIEGVTVTITGAGPDGVIGTNDDTETVVITDNNGNYNSGPLDPGDYKVTFSDLPDGFEFTTPNAGGDDGLDSDADPANGMTEVFTLAEGEDKDNVDAGLIDPIDPAHLGNRVFLDEDRDGIQDPGEQGLEGVTVTIDGAGDDGIFGTADDIQIVTITNINGIYRSGDIPPGDYKVTFSGLPDGFEFSPQDQGGDDTADSDVDPTNGMTGVITLAEGESNNTVDAGVVAPLKPARLGNRVFDDRNQNGIQDRGEQGVGGVTVTLTGGGEDGLLSTLDDNTEEVQVTRTRGNYFFNGLTPGIEYKVTFSDLPDGFVFTSQDQGSNDAKDSDADPTTGMTDTIVLAPGEVNATVDAGLVFTLTPDKNFIRGTIAPDFLRGTVANDDIRGLGDSDTILGFEGDDCLFGNGGFDVIRGGTGADTISGGQENDTLRGDDGSDIIIGGTGNDVLFGGAGRDILDGTNGSGANEQDTLAGNGGADIFVLGDVISQYYIAAGDDDFATINGFNAMADTLQLNGVADDYQTQQNGTDLELLSNGELIAVFTNTSSLDINSVANFV